MNKTGIITEFLKKQEKLTLEWLSESFYKKVRKDFGRWLFKPAVLSRVLYRYLILSLLLLFNKKSNRGSKAIIKKRYKRLLFNSIFDTSPYDDLSDSAFSIGNKIIFPSEVNPEVSIIIPVYNQINYTLRCLQSLKDVLPANISVEIIVINDQSNDDTLIKLQDQTKGVRIVNNETNLGFLLSCNKAALEAKGKYLCFLNNDTVVLPLWLESLLELIKSDSSIGAVGSKLIYPDGILQEAGGIIFSDASGWNFGRNGNPEDPEYNYVREVDYCSGASLMVRRDVFETLKGFDPLFAPAYYEDTDLCFSIRNKLNLKVLYQPLSQVIHYEGISSGKSLESGIKKHQLINQTRFLEKWQNYLVSHLDNIPQNHSIAPFRYTNQNKILIIDFQLPLYDRDSGSNRIFHILKIYKALGYHVIFFAEYRQEYDPYFSILKREGVEVLINNYRSSKSLYKQFLIKIKDVDIAWVCRPDLNFKYIDIIREKSKAKILYDTVDLHFLRLKRKAELEGDVKGTKWEQMRDLELMVAHKADVTITVTQVDKDILLENGISQVEVIPNIHVAYEGVSKEFEDRSGILFIGGYKHEPNVDAVVWLCEHIMPLVWKADPDIKVTLLGSSPTEEVLRLKSERVIVPGYLQEVSNYFLESRLFVAPLRYGAGMKGKIGQSFEYNLPVVSTKIGAEGMNLTNDENVLLAETEHEFADKILKAYKDKELWRKLSQNSRNAIKAYSIEVVKEKLKSIVNDAS